MHIIISIFDLESSCSIESNPQFIGFCINFQQKIILILKHILLYLIYADSSLYLRWPSVGAFWFIPRLQRGTLYSF